MRWLALAAVCALGCSGSHSADVDGGDRARAGAAYVTERGCPDCHRPYADGPLSGLDTPVDGTQAYPANLTPDRATGIGGWADVALVRAIRFGIAADGAPLCPTMPRFDSMGDVEVDAIVAFLRSQPAVSHAVPPSMCPPLKPPPAPDMAMPPTDM
jgi:hypothetical protein